MLILFVIDPSRRIGGGYHFTEFLTRSWSCSICPTGQRVSGSWILGRVLEFRMDISNLFFGTWYHETNFSLVNVA